MFSLGKMVAVFGNTLTKAIILSFLLDLNIYENFSILGVYYTDGERYHSWSSNLAYIMISSAVLSLKSSVCQKHEDASM